MRIDRVMTPQISKARSSVMSIGREGRIFRQQGDDVAAPAVALDGEFAVEQRQHDAVVGGCHRAIDDGDIAWEKPGTRHAVAGEMHRESCRRVAHQQFVEVERVVEIILGRRRKPAFRVGAGERHRHAGARPHIEKAVDVARPERALGETPGEGGNRQRQADNGRASEWNGVCISDRAELKPSSGEFDLHDFNKIQIAKVPCRKLGLLRHVSHGLMTSIRCPIHRLPID